MVKVVWFWFQGVWSCLPCCFSKGPLKRDFLDIYLTMFFGVCNFVNASAMMVIFLWKCSKINLVLQIAETNSENVFCFWDNCIWIRCLKLSLLRRKLLSSGVNMLTNILKTLHISNRGFFQVNCLHIDQWIW